MRRCRGGGGLSLSPNRHVGGIGIAGEASRGDSPRAETRKARSGDGPQPANGRTTTTALDRLPRDTPGVERRDEQRTANCGPSSQAPPMPVVPYRLRTPSRAWAQEDLLQSQLPPAGIRASARSRGLPAAGAAHHPSGRSARAPPQPLYALRSRWHDGEPPVQGACASASGLRRSRRAACNAVWIETSSLQPNLQRGPGRAHVSDLREDRSNSAASSQNVPVQRSCRVPRSARCDRDATFRPGDQQPLRAT